MARVTSGFPSFHSRLFCDQSSPMRLQSWLCFLLIGVSAHFMRSVVAGHLKDSDEVHLDTKSDPPPYVNRALSEREELGMDVPERSTSTFESKTSEARTFTSTIHDTIYGMAATLNVDPKTMFRFFRLAKVDKDLSKSVRIRKWFEYTAKLQRKKPKRDMDSVVFELLKGRSIEQQTRLFLTLRTEVKTYHLANRLLTRMLTNPTTRRETRQVLLLYDVTPQQVFAIMNLHGSSFQADRFNQWIKYTGEYRLRISNDIISKQKFLYPLYNMLKYERSTKQLMHHFHWSHFRGKDARKLASELRDIAKQEEMIQKALSEKKPPSVEKFANDVNLRVDVSSSFLQWLRYCQAYPKVARDKAGNPIIINDAILQQMVLDVVTQKVLVDQLPSLFQSVREAPGLEKFAEKMSFAVVWARANEKWLKQGMTPRQVYDMLWKDNYREDALLIPWLRYIRSYESKTLSIVTFKDLQASGKPFFSYNFVDAVCLEPMKNIKGIKMTAKRLQNEIFHQLKRNDMNPDRITAELKALDPGVDDRYRRTAESYAAYYDRMTNTVHLPFSRNKV